MIHVVVITIDLSFVLSLLSLLVSLLLLLSYRSRLPSYPRMTDHTVPEGGPGRLPSWYTCRCTYYVYVCVYIYVYIHIYIHIHIYIYIEREREICCAADVVRSGSLRRSCTAWPRLWPESCFEYK